MAFWYNSSDIIGGALIGFNNDVTGSTYLTLLLILIGFVCLALALKIRPDYIAIFLMPLVLYFFAFNGSFLVVVIVFAIVIGLIFAYNYYLT